MTDNDFIIDVVMFFLVINAIFCAIAFVISANGLNTDVFVWMLVSIIGNNYFFNDVKSFLG